MLQPGDRVLVRNLTEGGRTGKLQVYWEQVVHCVVERSDNGLVYKVKQEKGHTACLPREPTLLVNELPLPAQCQKGKTRQQNQNQTVPNPKKDNTDSSDEEYTYQ